MEKTTAPTRHEVLLRDHFSPAAAASDPALTGRILAMLLDWLQPERHPAYPTERFEDVARRFASRELPARGIGAESLLDEIARDVLPHTAHLNHPKYIGHMTQALPWMSVAVEALAAALNQNQVKVETAYASTLVEKQLLAWLHHAAYARSDAFYEQARRSRGAALGNAVSGGTMGNLTALAVALEHLLPGVRRHGLVHCLRERDWSSIAVLASARAHYSIRKALATLGLGEQALHLVAVDADGRIDLRELEERLAALRRDRVRVLAIVGIAGTTETGVVDPLPELAAIARREQAWFHVDAAWGGALLLSNRLRELLAGLELADSVLVDGHKLMWVPMAQGAVLFRDPSSLDALRHHAAYIIRRDSDDLGQTSLEGSRRFDALKLWASLKMLGTEGYAALLDHACGLAQTMRALVRERADFELTSDSGTFILTYRYVPAHLRELARTRPGDDAAGLACNRALNRLNALLQERQKAGGRSFVSRTVLESRACPEGITVLRVVLSNVLTTRAHLVEILAEQQALGEALARELEIGAATA